MGKKLSGQDVDAMIGDYAVTFKTVSISIEDGSKAAMDKGRPNGFVDGSISASGDVTLDTTNFNLIITAAKSAGSFMQLEPLDIVFNAASSNDELNIEAFECKLKVSDLLDAEAEGGEKLFHKIGYEVTGKEFVRINGVPYANTDRIEYLR